MLLAIAGRAAGQTFAFTLDPQQSTLTADIALEAQTAGTLIGNFNAVSNPTGTRTKPGFLSPGATENLPVRVEVDPRVAGSGLALRSSGGFVMSVDLAASTVAVSGFAADMLAGGPVTLPVSAQVSILEAFRTRSPDSTFIAGSANTQLGDGTLTALDATQVDGWALGTLTPLGGNQYSFTLTPMIALTGQAEFSGTELALPATPVALPLSGTITLNGGSAALSGTADLVLDVVDPTDRVLDPFPFDLPTILPPGGLAHVILNLNLDEVTTSVDGTQRISAGGSAVEAGDADLNGVIDIRDFFAIDRGRAMRLSGWANGDFTGNGVVDAADYAVIDRAFLAERSGPAAPGAAVPEAGVALAWVGAAVRMLVRRRGR